MEAIKRVRLSEIAELITKGTTPTTLGYNFQEDGVNFLKIECFSEDGTYIKEKTAHISEECHEKLKRSKLRTGDILFSIAGAIGRVAVVTEEMLPANTNQALAIIRVTRDDIYLPYIKLILTSQIVKAQFERKKQGVAQLNISLKDINELEIPLPEKSKQIECASLLEKISGIITARQQQLQKLDELVKARFVEIFGDPELNPRGLPVLPWNAVFLTTTGKLDSNAMVENGRYPFFTCAKESYKIDSYAFDCEALLLAGNNAAGIYDVKHYKGKFNAYQRTYVLRLMNEKWSYILFKRQLEDKLQYLQSQSKGTNTRYLTLGILNELRFVVPPVAEQEQFAAFVEQTDKSKVAVQKALDEAQLLFDSLMQKYFG